MLVSLAGEALQSERDHLMSSVQNLLDVTRNRLADQLRESEEVLDTFFESGGEEEGEEGAAPRGPRELADELSGLVRLPLRLAPEQQRLLRSDPDQVKPVVASQVQVAYTQQALTRLVGAIERRLEEPPGMEAAQLAQMEWDEIEPQVLSNVETLFNRRIERLVGEGDQVGKDLDAPLARVGPALLIEHLVGLLVMMPQGSRTTFDKKTHRRIAMQTARLTYTYFAGHLLDGRDPDQVAEDVLAHLQRAQFVLHSAHGVAAWSRLTTARWGDLDERTQQGLLNTLGEATCQRLQTAPLQSLEAEEVKQVIHELGRRALTEIYRQLLLGVITELWVDYLTQMEALRVSIGLEAYGQRDPLVQYKSRASELFQNLLRDMRLGVITRMFTYQPRNIGALQFGLKRTSEAGQEALPEAPETVELSEEVVEEVPDAEEVETPAETQAEPAGAGRVPITRSQKRRRRRH